MILTSTGRRGLTVVLAAVSVLGVACGGSSSSSTKATTKATTAATTAAPAATTAKPAGGAGPAINTNTAEVQALLDKALLAKVGLATLDPTIQKAFGIAAAPLSDEKVAVALDCWKSNKCTVPGGGDITVGIADGFAGNTWRQYSKMEAILQALAYPNVGKIMYLDANFDLAKMQANVRSLVAQGAKIIVGYNDFGAAMTPTFAEAQKAGAKVATYASPVPESTQAQVAAQVIPDLCRIGKEQADATAKAIGETGAVAFFNGTPGNPQGQAWNKCASDQFAAAHPGIKVSKSLDTGWTPDGAYKAASALIATGDKIDAILYDYADPMTQIYKAYDQAGKAAPAFVTWTVNNDLNKLFVESKGGARAFGLVYTNGTNWTARVAITAAIDALNGETVAAKVIFPQPFVVASDASWVKSRAGDFVESTLIPDALLNKMS
jgi:ABC-type sugar transport system substrate-binding protein